MAPDLQIAEWSMDPHDRVLYEKKTRQEQDIILILCYRRPPAGVSPMQWLRYSSPQVFPVTNLDMFCALQVYAMSSLVFRQQDTLV